MHHLKPIKNAFLKQDYNQGKINLIALHGLLGSKSNFKNLCNNTHISKHLQSAYLLDARNHGDSPHTSTMTYEEMALDLKEFIREHNIQNVVLMGHSMGGRIIFAYLHKYYTDPILGNIIVDISPKQGEGNNYVKNLNQIDLNNKTLKEIYDSVFRICQNKDKSNLIMTNLTYVDKEELHANYKWKINMDAIERFMTNGHQQFYSQYMGSAIVICGDKSEYVTQQDRPLFQNVFPSIDVNKDIHFVQGAGHWVQAEKPKDFLQLTSQYLTSIS